ncbi:unnamed protein product [Urochloa decumbens]|uniref:F-box domain-containing protein n=1 Tax=Urochloa decumbens TaxID=240449 RepID=A0ABC9FKH8_9POAL
MLELDELVEEVLLHIPPDDPASLLRAALVCRRWRRLISGPAFRRRFLELHHHTPPMLGFFVGNNFLSIADFVSTSSIRAFSRFPVKWNAIDARHGRVLLRCTALTGDSKAAFAVWDPITGELKELPLLPTARLVNTYDGSNAAVLCAVGGCSHLGCHRGDFLVVLVGIGFAYIYSSEAGAWTGRTTSADADHQHHNCLLSLAPSVLLGDTLYFMVCASSYYLVFGASNAFLKYDLSTGEMCLVLLPPGLSNKGTVLMAAENEELGLAWVEGSMLYQWSREPSGLADGVGLWAQSRAIELEMLLPADAISNSIDAIGSANGVGVIFLRTHVGIFTFDLRSSHVKKVSEARHYGSVLPYVSFYYTPPRVLFPFTQ